jgi:two-component system, NarL family, response regulator LiaR
MALKLDARLSEPLIYGVVLALLLLGLKMLQFKYILYDHSKEVYTGIIAIAFTIFGIWLAKNLFIKPSKEIVIKEVMVENVNLTANTEIDTERIAELGISPREMEILKMVGEGMSNQEIAGQLYISLSTVKTHVSNLFSKLNVKRRTQAIETARSLKILN